MQVSRATHGLNFSAISSGKRWRIYAVAWTERTCKVQIDFTEARLSIKLDPSGGLLRQFIDLNNQVLSRFTPEERRRIGIHTCPGGDQDATHSADVDYAQLMPDLFKLNAGNF